MAERTAIGKRARFEVFKRDKFTCQYCGKKAPDVVLQVDHIHPVADGGANDILNLITSCIDCNAGKGARLLTDTKALDLQRAQMEALQERREQLEMLIEWRSELDDMGVQSNVALEEAICRELGWTSLTAFGKGQLQKWLKKFALAELFEALDTSVGQYLQHDSKGVTAESAKKVFDYIPRIASVRRKERDKPWISNLLYIKGILRNRLAYVGEREAVSLLEDAFSAGGDNEELRRIARNCRNWSMWRDMMVEYLIKIGASS